MKELTATQKNLLDLLANALFGAGRRAEVEDPAALWTEANAQAVFLIALRDADEAVFPAGLRREIHDGVRRFLTRNVRLANAHAALSGLLESAGIPHVLIKGHASALWYPEPELRQLGDVDFYVDPADVERTEALLGQEGFAAEKTSHRFHHVFSRDGCRFELHYDIPGVPEGKRGEACRAYFADLLARSAVRHTPFGDMRLPSVFHHGLILLLHAAHHLTNSGIGLRHLCDWAVFASTLPDAEFERLYGTCLRELGLRRFACSLTAICVRSLGMPPAAWAEAADEALCDALLADMLEGGNFGQKNEVRSREAYLITSGHRQRSRLRRLFTVLLDMIYQKWPVTKKCRLLVPVGWAYYALRYLLRRFAGKRAKLYVGAAVRGAKDRIELYDRLQLFEGEKEEA